MTATSILVDRLGAENAARLSLIAGGQRLYVPKDLSRADRFKERLGATLAVLVILHFGDSRLYVPIGHRRRGAYHAPVDLAKVRKLARKGLSSAEIARSLECSIRTIDAKVATLNRSHTRKENRT